MTIHYLKGDALRPSVEGYKYIVHICNTKGGWGRGFVVALSHRWKKPEHDYKMRKSWPAGGFDVVPVEPEITVINMIAQEGIGNGDKCLVNFKALEDILTEVAVVAKARQASIHMPRIGCGLGGAKWTQIEPILKRTLVDQGLQVYVYDLP